MQIDTEKLSDLIRTEAIRENPTFPITCQFCIGEINGVQIKVVFTDCESEKIKYKDEFICVKS